ncbi:MAG: DUF2141 domain-containing protein [Ferruginibacter sp.]|nr:DUF2141 domain-containing protein [Cytophagales bacterium]
MPLQKAGFTPEAVGFCLHFQGLLPILRKLKLESMKKYGMMIVCGLGLAGLGFDGPPETGTIRLNVTHLRSDRGQVSVSLYRSEDGFPGNAARSFKTRRARIQAGKSEVVFVDVPPVGVTAPVIGFGVGGGGRVDGGVGGGRGGGVNGVHGSAAEQRAVFKRLARGRHGLTLRL